MAVPMIFGAATGCGRVKPDGGSVLELKLPALCDDDTDAPPVNLVCTGLYGNIGTKAIAPGIRPYAPATPLWSDGAEKQRWISLPPKGVIDDSNPNEWSFPVGTKLFKEFSRNGRRVETRLWHKADTDFWVNATYAWNSDETAATRTAGGDIVAADGEPYHIPTPEECTKCHRGRTERILGFEAVSLGMAGATGVTLTDLAAKGQLSPPPSTTDLLLGDDGTGTAAPALSWLHVNCGVSCHNANPNSLAYAAGLLLRLDPANLDGRPVTDSDQLRTMFGVPAVTPAWNGQSRIVPGDLDQSLLYQLISHRGQGTQMPPFATNVVDENGSGLVGTWIAAQAPLPPPTDTPTDTPSDVPTDVPPDPGAESPQALSGKAVTARTTR